MIRRLGCINAILLGGARGCIWRRPLVAVVGVLPLLQVAVSGRSVLLPRDSAAIRMCARLTDSIAADHYTAGSADVCRVSSAERTAVSDRAERL